MNSGCHTPPGGLILDAGKHVKVIAAWLLLTAFATTAHAAPTRYQLTSLVGYFDYDTATSMLYDYNFKEGPLSTYSFMYPVDLVNAPATGSFLPQFSAGPDHLYFTDRDITFDASFRYEWHILFEAAFFQPGDPSFGGTYDGAVRYAGELDVYSLADNHLAIISNSPLGGEFGFFSIGAAPIPTAPVPLPETYAMTLAGLGFIGFVSRRKKLKSITA